MASVIRLSYEEMEELELWASISDTITILYDELIDAEFEYGAFSPQYNEVADKIKLSLEVESDIENKYFEDPNLLKKACHYPTFAKNERLQERMKNDYRALVNNKDSEMYHRLRNVVSKVDDALVIGDEKVNLENEDVQIKALVFFDYSFNFAKNKSFLAHIEEELKGDLDEERREELVALKNITISSNGMLEKMYFSMCDFDALLSYDEMFAEHADMPIEKYNEYKNAFFKTSCFNVIDDLDTAKRSKRRNQDWLYELHLVSDLDNMNDPSSVYDYISKHFEELDKTGSLHVISGAIEKTEIDKSEGSVKTLRFN